MSRVYMTCPVSHKGQRLLCGIRLPSLLLTLPIVHSESLGGLKRYLDTFSAETVVALSDVAANDLVRLGCEKQVTGYDTLQSEWRTAVLALGTAYASGRYELSYYTLVSQQPSWRLEEARAIMDQNRPQQ